MKSSFSSLLTRSGFLALSLVMLAVSAMAEQAAAQVDWLPDIIVREADLYNNDIVTDITPGRVHLRFSTSTCNIGMGRLHLIGILPPLQDGTQLVMQRIFRDDGTFWDDTSGSFLYHPTHSHTHFEDWCAYRLREILPGDGVGAVVAEGDKTSFCILDLAVYNSSLPNFNPSPNYPSCNSTVQGLSVGWLDLYSKSLPGQNIDVTDVPDGQYWLEAHADPENNIRESDTTNNITRIKVTIGSTAGIQPDAYEPDDSFAAVDARIEGGTNSPNLGPTGPRTVITGLSIHSSNNSDYFRFYSAGTGTANDTIRIDFTHTLGDLDLSLYDANRVHLATSEGVSNREIILMTGRPAGWYYIRAFGYQVATNPSYSLMINPPANTAPTITVFDPPIGVTERIHGFENYTTTWETNDANGDPTWVTVYANTSPVLDGNEIEIEASINTPGSDGYHIINSASLPTGTYWLYARVTDGGQISGAWSAGQIAFLAPADSDGDGVFDFEDNCAHWANPEQAPVCVAHGDPMADGNSDILDVIALVDIAFRNAPALVDDDCPHGTIGRTDLNCDGATDIIDVAVMVDAAFRGTSPVFCNPCDCVVYPSSCP